MIEGKKEFVNIDDRTIEIVMFEPKNKFKKMPSGYGIVQTEIMRLNISIQAKAIYCLLASYTGSKDYCFPTIKTISDDLKISEKLVYKYMKELKKEKLIIVSKLYKDNRNNNKYEICYIDTTQNVQFDTVENVHVGTVENKQVDNVRNDKFINNNNINNNNINVKKDKNYDENNLLFGTYDDYEDLANCIYNAYPSIDEKNKRSTHKSKKDKDKIIKLVKDGLHPRDLLEMMMEYLENCNKSKCYLRDLSRFLNNLPEREE